MTIHTYSDHILTKSSFNGAPTNATQAGVAVDTLAGTGAPFRRAALIIDIVTGSATTVAVTVSDSPDNSTWTPVASSQNPATPQAATLPASGVAGNVYVTNIDLSKRQRYLRANVVGTGTAGTVTCDFQLFQSPYAANTPDHTAVTI